PARSPVASSVSTWTRRTKASRKPNTRSDSRSERARLFAQRYLKRVAYGNRVPGQAGGFLFEVVFDYGEHTPDLATVLADGDPPPPRPTPEEDPHHPWPCREDPFSTSRPGFEVRTYRLCQRILVFHHVKEGGFDGLVRSIDLSLPTGPHGHAPRVRDRDRLR